MPFLRFTRDKRGYETTALVHSIRRDGRSHHRILYWFRTPPGVRVGRPALDEEAIRLIEQQNPDVEFDWPKILEAKPPSAPPAEDPRARRRRDRIDRGRKPAPAQRAPAAKPAESSLAPGAATDEPPESVELPEPLEPEEPLEPREPLEPIEPDPSTRLPPAGADSLRAGESTFALRATADKPDEPDQLNEPDELDEPVVSASVGPELLTRLRARYAELLARITERAGSPERVEALRAQALTLDPDGWVTDAEVRAGVEAFETRMRDLRGALGLRRRRRSRRGGRRRKPDAREQP